MLRKRIEVHDSDRHHSTTHCCSRGTWNEYQTSSMFGCQSLGLLLCFGDVATARSCTARVGLTKVLDAHRRVLAGVQDGAVGALIRLAYRRVFDMDNGGSILNAALLILGELGMLHDTTYTARAHRREHV